MDKHDCARDLRRDEGQMVLPDVIVHKRGVDTNLLIIEMKKSANQRGMDRDRRRIRAFRNELGYQFGALVVCKTGDRPAIARGVVRVRVVRQARSSVPDAPGRWIGARIRRVVRPRIGGRRARCGRTLALAGLPVAAASSTRFRLSAPFKRLVADTGRIAGRRVGQLLRRSSWPASPAGRRCVVLPHGAASLARSVARCCRLRPAGLVAKVGDVLPMICDVSAAAAASRPPWPGRAVLDGGLFAAAKDGQRRRGPVARDSRAAQLVRVSNAGQPSGWPATSGPARSAAAVTWKAGTWCRTCGAG